MQIERREWLFNSEIIVYNSRIRKNFIHFLCIALVFKMWNMTALLFAVINIYSTIAVEIIVAIGGLSRSITRPAMSGILIHSELLLINGQRHLR